MGWRREFGWADGTLERAIPFSCWGRTLRRRVGGVIDNTRSATDGDWGRLGHRGPEGFRTHSADAAARRVRDTVSVRTVNYQSPWRSVFASDGGPAASRVLGEEGTEVVGQDLRLVDGDEGSAVVDPHQLCVLEVFGESFGVGGGHELVVSCPDDEDRTGEGALQVGPLEQLLRLGDGAEVLGEVAADLGVVA